MTTHTLKTRLEVTEEFLSDLMITAFDGQYGGCWFWATSQEIALGPWLETNEEADRWLSAKIQKEDELELWAEARDNNPKAEGTAKVWHVTHQTLVLGMQRILDKNEADGGYYGTSATIRGGVAEDDAGDIDANIADSIVQMGLFGEEIYG